MKKFLIIVLTILVLLMVGCLDNYVPKEKYDSKVEELEVSNQTITDKDKEIEKLNGQLDNLITRLNLSEEETEKYQNLITNLNELLKNVYYVYQKKSDGSSVWGTGFSIEYQGNYYLVTAGHAIENEYGIFKSLGFKDTDNKWVYPKLLTYEVNVTIPDYAIFYSDKIDSGLKVDINNTEPDYRLGINKLIQENNNWGIGGECGSPIIDLDGEVIGVHAGYLTDIDLVLEAIDKLE